MLISGSCTFVTSVCCIVLNSLFGVLSSNLLVSSNAQAEETSGFVLESGRWEQLTIPANASNLSVRQLFSEELPVNEYKSGWIVYLFDAESGLYRDPGIEGRIPQGAGFWMIQTTNVPVTLGLSDSLWQTDTQVSNACPMTTGCTEIPLSAGAGVSTNNMIGSALDSDTLVTNVRIRTQEDSACRNGCSWDEADDLQYVSGNLWHYDSTLNEYMDLAVTGRIGVWQSVWLQTLPALQASETEILFPAHSEQPDCISSSGFAGDDGLKLWCWPDLATEINALTDQSFIDNGRLFTSVTGLLRIWLDDVLVYDARERTSYPAHEEGGYWKVGIYKWRWQRESNIAISEALGITRLQTSMGSLRVIKNDPDDAAYLTDQYALVDPVQDSHR